MAATQQALDDRNEFPSHHLRISFQPETSAHGQSCVRSQQDFLPEAWDLRLRLLSYGSDHSKDSPEKLDDESVLYYEQGSAIPQIASFLSRSLEEAFSLEEASIAHKYQLHQFSAKGAELLLKSVPQHVQDDLSRTDLRALKGHATYHLTFSLFTAGAAPSSWAIEEALSEHVTPWKIAMQNIAHINITTQVQTYSTFAPSFQTHKSADSNATIIKAEDLSAFVNAAEWPLSPSIGAGQTLNFLVYVPAINQTPLEIADDGGTSWLIPQWGGVKILSLALERNLETDRLQITSHLDADALRPTFETFTSQMLLLLGIPSTSQLSTGSAESSLDLCNVGHRLASYTRLMTLSYFLRASSTLGSLARLSQSLSQIPIPKCVASLVSTTMKDLQATCDSLNQGEWKTALTHSRQAHQAIEKAFFEKSMVGQVYFPDEHKIAVYLPLLGPVGVPLLLALMKELKTFVARSRKSP